MHCAACKACLHDNVNSQERTSQIAVLCIVLLRHTAHCNAPYPFSFAYQHSAEGANAFPSYLDSIECCASTPQQHRDPNRTNQHRAQAMLEAAQFDLCRPREKDTHERSEREAFVVAKCVDAQAALTNLSGAGFRFLHAGAHGARHE